VKIVTLWMCEDLGGDDPPQHGFGRTKGEAERYVSGNRGYDGYDGSGFGECVADGWAKPAVRIVVPEGVAAVLLARCRV